MVELQGENEGLQISLDNMRNNMTDEPLQHGTLYLLMIVDE